MGKTTLPPEFIAYMSVLYLFKSPGRLADIGNGFWWFIVPALTAQCISIAVKIVEKAVGHTTWKKMEEHAKKAMCVASLLELIAIREVGMMVLSDIFWARLLINCFCIGMIGVVCVCFILDVAKGGKPDKVDMVQ